MFPGFPFDRFKLSCFAPGRWRDGVISSYLHLLFLPWRHPGVPASCGVVFEVSPVPLLFFIYKYKYIYIWCFCQRWKLALRHWFGSRSGGRSFLRTVGSTRGAWGVFKSPTCRLSRRHGGTAHFHTRSFFVVSEAWLSCASRKDLI